MKILLFFFSYLFVINGFAQDFAWVKKITDEGYPTHGTDIGTDSDGNIYTIGFFEGPVDFDPNIGETVITATITPFNSTSIDMFIQKLNPYGELIWVKTIEGIGYCYGKKIKIMGDFIYITGLATSDNDFDVNEGEFYLETNQDTDIFILKMALSGEFIWARNFGGGGNDRLHGFDIDNEGNIFTTGFFYGNVDFDPGDESFIMSSGDNDVKSLFVQKLDSNGNFIWAKQIDGNIFYSASYNHLVVYDNHIAFTGAFYDEIDFNPNGGVNYLNSNQIDFFDTFILQLSTDGLFEWVKQIDCIDGNSRGCSIDVGYNNEIIVVSLIDEEFILNPASENISVSSGYEKSFVVEKLSSQGDIIWYKNFGNYFFDCFNGELLIDNFDNIYISDTYSDSLDFDPSEENQYLTANLWANKFVLKLNSDGEFQWVTEVDLLGNSVICNAAQGLAIDNMQNVYSMGNFVNEAKFNTDGDAVVLHEFNSGFGSVYIQKLSNCVHSRVDTVSTCEPYLWIDGNTYDEYFVATYYTDSSIISSCDSIITLVLNSSHDIDTNVYIMLYDKLFSGESEGLYQWYQCVDEELILLEGETDRGFYPIDDNTYYAVSITQHGCTKFSGCYSLNSVGIEESNQNTNLSIFPNPSSGTITIELSADRSIQQIRILNAMGQIVRSINTNESLVRIDLSGYPSGLYVVQVINEGVVRQSEKLILNH